MSFLGYVMRKGDLEKLALTIDWNGRREEKQMKENVL